VAAKDRIQAIKQMVANDKKVTVSNLSGIFQVTEETIRRDLEKLEDEGFLTRTYGGAVLNTAMLTENIHFYNITILHILQYITKYNQYFCYLNAILTIYSLTFQNLRFNPACTASPLQAIIFEIILLMTKYEIPDVMHLSKKSCGNGKSFTTLF